MHGGFGSALDYGFLMNDKDDERGKGGGGGGT